MESRIYVQTSGIFSASAARLQHVYKDSGSCYGIEWRCRGLVLYPHEIYGDCMYLDESKIARFSSGEGLVGKAWQQRETIFLTSVRDASNEFFRKRSALDDGIESIVFVWCRGCVFEFGFMYGITELPHCELSDVEIPCFTPIAHHRAFVSPTYLHPDMREKQQMPSFRPPRSRIFFQMDEVRRHTSKDDAWIVIHGNVYNITNFIKHHPGWMVGSQSATILAILRNLGTDCTLEFDAIHPDYAIRQLADYRIGEVQLDQGPSKGMAKSDDTWKQTKEHQEITPTTASVTFMEFMSCNCGLIAEYMGGTTLAQLCIATSELRNTLQVDANSLRVLENRAYFTIQPCEEVWGLTAGLEAIGTHSIQFHEDTAIGACVIGKSGLRRGLASFQFVVQDFAGALFGVTTCLPDSQNAMDQVLDTQVTTLFALAGGLLGSRENIYDPNFTRGQDPALALNIIVSVDMSSGILSFVATSSSGQLFNKVDVLRPEWRQQYGYGLFPVIFSTHISLSQFQTGSATCTGIAL